jgi:hypothetical protein
MKSQAWASALVAVFRLHHDAPSEGRRRLFDAVNEAFVEASQPIYNANFLAALDTFKAARYASEGK